MSGNRGKHVIVTAIERLEHVRPRVGEIEGPGRVQPVGVYRATRAVKERYVLRNAVRPREGSKVIVEGVVFFHDDNDTPDRSCTRDEGSHVRGWRGRAPPESIGCGGQSHGDDRCQCQDMKPASSPALRTAVEHHEDRSVCEPASLDKLKSRG